MEKVTVSKEVAEAIEALRQDGHTDEEIVRVLADPGDSWLALRYVALNEAPLTNVIKALFIGYEIEKSPAETIKAKFAQQRDVHSDLYIEDMTDTTEYAYADGYMTAIRDFAKAYGIKIEGVNV